MSGIEVAGLALAVFPLLIKALEHYQDAYDTVRDFAHFRREFAHLVAELNREQIMFRQNLEGMLRPIAQTEFELQEMMSNPDSELWISAHMEGELKQKLCGQGEYETYQSSMKAIHANLVDMRSKLASLEARDKNTEGSSQIGQRLQHRIAKLQFILRKKKWRGRIIDLGRQIDRVGQLVRTAEALAPARQSRRVNAAHRVFAQIRAQASSLHRAILNGFTRCDCDMPHAFKLVMAERFKKGKGANPEPRRLKVSFLWKPPLKQPEGRQEPTDNDPDNNDLLPVPIPQAWRSFDATMTMLNGIEPLLAESENNPPTPRNPRPSSPTESSSIRSSGSVTYGRSSSRSPSRGSESSITAPTTVSRPQTASSYAAGKPFPISTSFGNQRPSKARSPTTITIPLPIDDLCRLVPNCKGSVCVGYLSDGQTYHVLHVDSEFSFNSDNLRDNISMVSLESVLADDAHVQTMTLSRRHRMSVALTLAYAVLELHPTPWLPGVLSKSDISFFRRSNGEILAGSPFLLCRAPMGPQQTTPAAAASREYVDHSTELLGLGILIMELWFGQTIESMPFYKEYCDAQGNAREFTKFGAALEWQKRAIDEGGMTLHDVTSKCVRGNFGESVIDLNADKCVGAVHDQVVKPLESIMESLFEWPGTRGAP